MAAIGIGLVFISYTAGLYGYCLFRGYNVTPKQMFTSNWPQGIKGAGSNAKPPTVAPPGAGRPV